MMMIATMKTTIILMEILPDTIIRFANLSKIEEVVVKADQVEEDGPTQDIWWVNGLRIFQTNSKRKEKIL